MSNDHYVPQHFLRAWACDEGGKKLHRYKRIAHTGRVEFKEQSIISSGSGQDLYQISDGEKKAEFETSVMTKAVDTPFSPVLEKFHFSGLKSLSQDERGKLARYIVILEGRNPHVIGLMQEGVTNNIDVLLEPAKEDGISDATIAEMQGLLERMLPTLGAAAAGMFAGWGHGQEAKALLEKQWVEIDFDKSEALVTSNYPVGRWNWYTNPDSYLLLALTPRKALVIGNEKYCQTFLRATRQIQARVLNLMTIARATEAYCRSNSRSLFVERHLGWMLNQSEDKYSSYLACALAD